MSLGNRLRRVGTVALAVTAVTAGTAQAHVYLGPAPVPHAAQQAPTTRGHHLLSGHIVQQSTTQQSELAQPVLSQSSGINWGRVAAGAATISFLLILAAAGGISVRRGRMVHR